MYIFFEKSLVRINNFPDPGIPVSSIQFIIKLDNLLTVEVVSVKLGKPEKQFDFRFENNVDS